MATFSPYLTVPEAHNPTENPQETTIWVLSTTKGNENLHSRKYQRMNAVALELSTSHRCYATSRYSSHSTVAGRTDLRVCQSVIHKSALLPAQ